MSTTQHQREFEFTMPIGVANGDGSYHREGTLRKMTGRDEAILADPKNQRNGGKLVTDLLHSCIISLNGVEKITKELIARMYSADRNFLLIKLRSFTFGNELEASYTCPSCSHNMRVLEDLDDLLVRNLREEESPEEILVELEDGYIDKENNVHTALTLRLPTGADESAVAPQMRKNASLAKNSLLARCMKSLGDVPQHRLNALGPKIMSDLTMSDRRLIDRTLNSSAPGVDLIRELECVSCGFEFKASLDMTHFLAVE